ncbi:tumor necrosis factor-inducible gene 6 protein-like [Clavelina lepadiformis]|uniref:tumor necrosis factor-inducible gene 6 protein-like n=1 Tax=Clavelina lepadiformis TaxID=159417 RepID=UPI0040426256
MMRVLLILFSLMLGTYGQDCGGNLVAPTGIRRFNSPGYPNNYTDNTDCEWRIRTGRNAQIVIKFEDFETEEIHDYVEIEDGSETLRYSGKALVNVPYMSRNSEIVVRFHSDAQRNFKGFRASYTKSEYFGINAKP